MSLSEVSLGRRGCRSHSLEGPSRSPQVVAEPQRGVIFVAPDSNPPSAFFGGAGLEQRQFNT